MFNLLLESISTAIYKEFGKEYKIYRNEIKQGFCRPCFFIKILNSIQLQAYNQRRKKNNLININYFSKKEDVRDINDICDRLYSCMEFIELDKHLIRGTDMESTVSDGVLIFTINYNFHITTPKNKIYMDNLKQNGGIKNGY